MHKPLTDQRGVSLIFIILVIVLILLLGFAGWRIWGQNQPETTTETATMEEADEADKPEAGERVSPLDNSYSVIKPSGWAAKTCEFEGSEGVLFLAPNETLLGTCASEFGGTVFTSRTAGDNRMSDEDYSGSDWVSNFVSQDSELGELSARKISYTVVAENELDYPPLDTKLVQYQAFNGTDTYSVTYTQLPDSEDYTTEIEAMVASFRLAE